MIHETHRLCLLIQGKICMPIIYRNELEQIVNRPNLNFCEIANDPYQDVLSNRKHLNSQYKL